MRVIFTGGGTGGHFYPIIAVAEEINRIVEERKLISPELFYIAPEPYDERALYENGITYVQSPAGKVRRYFSILNVLDLVKTAIGVVSSLWQVYRIYPDVVFSKGGYASFPTLVAARLLRIPIIVHESDATPGRVNAWAAKFAQKVAVSYPEAADKFPRPEIIAFTGNPTRRGLTTVGADSGKDFLELDRSLPTLLILGGSQGAARINDTILDALPQLVLNYQVVHQAGKNNFEEVQRTANFILRGEKYQTRYRVFPFLNLLELRMAAGAASIVISRAGSGTIFEIANWGLPSIIIPIPENISHDQYKNAFAYARSGAAVVIEEKNLAPHLLISEIDQLMKNESQLKKMREAAKKFSTPDAARTIAEAIVNVALAHEPH